MPLSIFGFRALWSPVFLTLVIAIVLLYFFLTTKWRVKFAESEVLKISQGIYFVLAMLIVYIVKGSPFDLMGHILFSVHMAQMAILYMVVTPLIIFGIPNWIWNGIFKIRIVRKIFLFFTQPILSVLLFSIFFSFYHIPVIFDAIKLNEFLHSASTIILFIFSLFLWWPVLNSLQGQYQISGLKKVGYIIASAVLLTPACGMVIFAGSPLYAAYSNGAVWMKSMSLCVPADTLSNLNLSGPELFSNMPVTEDQQLGGVIMKIIQEIVDGAVLAKVFFDWFRKDQEEAENLTKMLLSKDLDAAE